MRLKLIVPENLSIFAVPDCSGSIIIAKSLMTHRWNEHRLKKLPGSVFELRPRDNSSLLVLSWSTLIPPYVLCGLVAWWSPAQRSISQFYFETIPLWICFRLTSANVVIKDKITNLQASLCSFLKAMFQYFGLEEKLLLVNLPKNCSPSWINTLPLALLYVEKKWIWPLKIISSLLGTTFDRLGP